MANNLRASHIESGGMCYRFFLASKIEVVLQFVATSIHLKGRFE